MFRIFLSILAVFSLAIGPTNMVSTVAATDPSVEQAGLDCMPEHGNKDRQAAKMDCCSVSCAAAPGNGAHALEVPLFGALDPQGASDRPLREVASEVATPPPRAV